MVNRTILIIVEDDDKINKRINKVKNALVLIISFNYNSSNNNDTIITSTIRCTINDEDYAFKIKHCKHSRQVIEVKC